MGKGRFVFGAAVFFLGLILLVNGTPGLTGYAVLDEMAGGFSSFWGAVALITGAVLTVVSAGQVGELEGIVTGRRPKKPNLRKTSDLIAEGWSPQDMTFRRKLTNLFDENKEISAAKLAYALPFYKSVTPTRDSVPGARGEAKFKVYKGLREDGKTDYFTVDSAEAFDLYLDKGRVISVASHIDLQRKRGKQGYEQIGKKDIPWDSLIEANKDVLDHYHVSPDSMLADFHRHKPKSQKH